jgi:hypothetical protein
MKLRRIRVRPALAAAALVLVGVAGWLFGSSQQASTTRVDLLRAAFDEASSECYVRYRGARLHACLAGVMDAHLQALEGAEPPNEDTDENNDENDDEDTELARVRLQRL